MVLRRWRYFFHCVRTLQFCAFVDDVLDNYFEVVEVQSRSEKPYIGVVV